MQVWEYTDAWAFRHIQGQRYSILEVEVDQGVVACLGVPKPAAIDPQQPLPDNMVVTEIYFLKCDYSDLRMAECWHRNIRVVGDAAAVAGPLLGVIALQTVGDGVLRPAPPIAQRKHTNRAGSCQLLHPRGDWQARMLPVGLCLPDQQMVGRIFNRGWMAETARRIAVEIVRSARGVTACSVLTNIYRPNDLVDYEVDKLHLLRIRDAAGDIQAVTLRTPPTDFRAPQHTCLVTIALLPIAVETWRTRDRLTDGIPSADWWRDLLTTGLDIPSETILNVWAGLFTRSQMGEVVPELLQQLQRQMEVATGLPSAPIRYLDHRARN